MLQADIKKENNAATLRTILEGFLIIFYVSSLHFSIIATGHFFNDACIIKGLLKPD